jgi:hypothetical protein
LAIGFFALWQFGHFADQQIRENKKIESGLYSLFLADSLVKNLDENGLLGIASLDPEKHRVKSNELRSEKIFSLEKNEFVFEAWAREKNGAQKIFFSKNASRKNCVSIERLVLLDGSEALFGVKVCG